MLKLMLITKILLKAACPLGLLEILTAAHMGTVLNEELFDNRNSRFCHRYTFAVESS